MDILERRLWTVELLLELEGISFTSDKTYFYFCVECWLGKDGKPVQAIAL